MAGTVEGDGSTTAAYQIEHPCPLPETMTRPSPVISDGGRGGDLGSDLIDCLMRASDASSR